MTVRRIFTSNLGAVVCVYLVQSLLLLGQEEKTAKEYIEWYTKTYMSNQGGVYTPEELDPITQLEKTGDTAAALHAYDEIIKRDVGLFPTRPYANWVKSLAYLNRSRLKAELNESWFNDMAAAAELGNAQAVQNVSDSLISWVTENKKNPKYKDLEVDRSAIEKYLRIGAELGSWKLGLLLGSENWPNTLSRKEKVYWKLIALSFVPYQGKTAEMQSTIRGFGSEKVNAALKEFSPTAGVMAADASGLPPRGTIATVFTDSNLRRTYGESYGRRQTPTRSGKTPSALDEFKFLSAIGDETGLYRAYMMVPGDRKFSDPTIISLKVNDIVAKLSPGDTVIVRCGPITHLAVAYKIDQRRDQICFADGLFQYWQPTHNSCIKSFTLTPFEHGGFLACVSLKEITPMIQAVITFRDRTSNTSQLIDAR